MKKTLFYLLFVLFLLNSCAFSIEIKKVINKKPKPEKVRMVETEEEWKIEAQNVPLEERKLNDFKEEVSTKKYYYPEPKYRFEKYNYPQGTKEADLSEIKKEPVVYSKLVADPKCHYVAYSRYFYAPDNNQISSNFYIGKLDTSKIKTKRMLDYNPLGGEKKLILESGLKERYPNLFRSLTLVDWNNSSTKLLIKEKTGSLINGIYRTTVYVHFMGNSYDDGYTLKLNDLDYSIKNYLSAVEEINLDKYIYELAPLGFSSDNDSLILIHCYLHDKNNKRIFMGLWGYNCDTNETLLISRDNPVYSLSLNGLIVKQVLD